MLLLSYSGTVPPPRLKYCERRKYAKTPTETYILSPSGGRLHYVSKAQIYSFDIELTKHEG